MANVIDFALFYTRTNQRAQALYEPTGWQSDELFLAYHWTPSVA